MSGLIRQRQLGDEKIEVWMWESIGGWEKVGEITPSIIWQWWSIDVSGKFDTFAKLNSAKMRIRYVEVE